MEEHARRHALIYVDRTGDIEQIMSFLKTIAWAYETSHRLFELPFQVFLKERLIFTQNDFEKVSFLPSENLYIASINCSSPGFWEFVGNLNPLKFIIDMIEAINKWKESYKSWQLDITKFQYESVSSYMDLLDRYDKMMNEYGEKIPHHRRFIKEKVEKIIQEIEKNVIPFSSKGKSPKLLKDSEKPKEYVSINDIKDKGSRSISGTILSVLNPKNEKFRDLFLLSFYAENQGKLTREQIVDQINSMIDQGFVIFDRENNRLEPTKSGLSFYESLSKLSED